jgi:hypothetical protein
MNKYQKDQLDMLLAVNNYFKKNTALWTPFLPIVPLANTLDADVNKILGLLGQAQMRNTGFAMDKIAKRQLLQDNCLAHSTILSAYYSITQQSEQIKSVYYNNSTLKNSTAAALIGTAYKLHATAASLQLQLLHYSVSAASLQAFDDTIQAFNTIIDTPKQAQIKSSEANIIAIATLKARLSIIKMQQDKLVALVPDSTHMFATVYFNIRKISRSPTHKRSLQIICTDASTGKALPNMQWPILNTKLKGHTKLKGSNYIQNMKAGKYILQINGDGYTVQHIAFSIVANMATKVNVVMMAV